MRPTAPRPRARALRRLLLLPLSLLLALAAHSAVTAGIGRQRAADGAAPQTWFHFRRRGDAERTDEHHRKPSPGAEASDGDRRRDKRDEGRADEAYLEDCKSHSTGEGQVPCERQRAEAESPGGRSSWLRHYLRAARHHRRRRLANAAPPSRMGEDVCLKEDMRNSIFHQKASSSITNPEIRRKTPGLFGNGIENLDEISKQFCRSGSILILSASLKTHGTGLTGILQLKIQCAPSVWRTDFIRSHDSNDGKKCYSWSAIRDFGSFMDIIGTYVSNGRRRNELYCFLHDGNSASCSYFNESRGNASKNNSTKILPKVVKGIKCRYDLVEGAVNDIGQMRAGCKKNCTKIAGRIVCSCPAFAVNGSSKVKDEDNRGVVRHCRPLDTAAGGACPKGYFLDSETMVCIDVDECLKSNGGCAHECENTNGGFQCKCRPGFFLMEDQKTCDDRDECAIGVNGRSFAGCAYKCTNLPGGYMCSCPDGYVASRRDPTSCVNPKENITLTLEGLFYSKPTVPAVEGECPKGFLLDANNVTCTDIDECRLNISGCSQVCHNIYGGFKCKCRAGFSLKKDRKTCEDFNECHYHFISKCQDLCENTEGSYRCKCRSGFVLKEDQKSCQDIDECRENTAGCNQLCENTPGSYKCSCNYGFYLLDDRKTCQDIDECRLNISGCAHECENTEGSFICKCRAGYYLAGDGKSCADVDECRRNTSGCTHHCENTAGSYRCSCRPGYFLMEDGRSCDDRDECAADGSGRMYAPCSHECINLPSGFMCSCPEGYVIDARVPGLCVEEEGHRAVTGAGSGADLS